MIPLSITLKNFLSYGETEQTISFEGYSLICLSGKNGHGKSALLDAITWAVWGQARKTTGVSKPDEGLIRLGASQMLVQFEFIFNGVRYKVRREFFMAHAKPYAVLEFATFDAEKNDYVSLTDKTIRRTQEKIEQTILLDYETYTNSSFLRQGSANEFSRKAPKERKKILGTILGLHIYDSLQTAALEKARAYQQQRKILEELIAADAEFIGRRQELESEYLAARGQLSEHEQHIAEKVRLSREGALKLSLLSRQKETQEMLNAQYAKALQGFTIQKEAWLQAARAWRIEHASTISLSGPALLEQELAVLDRSNSEMQKAQGLLLQYKEMLLSLSGQEQQERKRIAEHIHAQRLAITVRLQEATTTKAHTAQRLALLEQQCKEYESQKAAAQQDLEKRVLQIEQVSRLLGGKAAILKQFEKRKTFYTTYRQQANWLHSQLKEFEHKKETLTAQEEASCPLCEQLITAKRKAFLLSKLSKDQRFLQHRYVRLHGLVTRLKELLVAQNEEVGLLEQSEKHYNELLLQQKAGQSAVVLIEERFVEVHAQMTSLHNIATQVQGTIVQCQEQLQELPILEQQLVKTDTALQEIIVRTTELQKIRDALVYSEQAHRDLQGKMELLRSKISEAYNKGNLQAVLHERLKSLHDKKVHIKALQQDLAVLGKQVQSAHYDTELYAQLVEQQKAQQEELAALQNEKEAFVARVAKLEQSLQDIDKKTSLQRARQEKIKAIDVEIDDYQKLGALWGKNGIQALLIEEAIPEIEEEANKLLSRLSNNQAQIFIESLRDLKKGGVRETLDIKISDSMGIRPYEMFSGGEAFRIDFALRIAISKLLARRAGASLQLLIIDEGFGSQDEEGLQRLMEALHSIRSDFEKIIVVSHLPEFKENFPVHFVVEKQARGSVVSVEQRG